MKKTIISLLTLLLAGQGIVLAQVAPGLTKKYPWHVVSQVLEMNSKLNLSLGSQFKLAQFYNTEDSLANLSLRNGATAEKVSADRKITNDKLIKILTPPEFDKYAALSRDKSDSQFSDAINLSTILVLDRTQIDKLVAADKQLKQKIIYNTLYHNPLPFSQDLFEGQQLKNILNDAQYSRFLSYKVRATASDLTVKDWYAIKNAGLSNGEDSVELNGQIRSYHMFQEAGKLKIKNGVNNLQEDSIKRGFDRAKPTILIKLDTYIGKGYNSQLANAVKYRQELNLTKNQLSSLLDAQVALERKRFSFINAEMFNAGSLEWAPLASILNDKQFGDLLYKSSQKNAAIYTNERWNLLTKFKLNKSLDSTKTTHEIFNYLLEREVANLRKKDLNQSINADSLYKTVETSRPLILYKLDVYLNKFPSSNFGMAMKFRKEIALKGNQLDSILKRLRDFEILKNTSQTALAAGKPNDFNSKKYEADELLVILTPKQLTMFLQFKNYQKALDLTKQNWAKIKKFELSSGTDSALVNQQNLAWQVNLLMATDRMNFDSRPEIAEFRRQTESRKPEILAKLEEASRKYTSGRDTKKSFAW